MNDIIPLMLCEESEDEDGNVLYYTITYTDYAEYRVKIDKYHNDLKRAENEPNGSISVNGELRPSSLPSPPSIHIHPPSVRLPSFPSINVSKAPALHFSRAAFDKYVKKKVRKLCHLSSDIADNIKSVGIHDFKLDLLKGRVSCKIIVAYLDFHILPRVSMNITGNVPITQVLPSVSGLYRIRLLSRGFSVKYHEQSNNGMITLRIYDDSIESFINSQEQMRLKGDFNSFLALSMANMKFNEDFRLFKDKHVTTIRVDLTDKLVDFLESVPFSNQFDKSRVTFLRKLMSGVIDPTCLDKNMMQNIFDMKKGELCNL